MQTSLFCPRLNDHWDVAISSFYGLEGSPVMYKGLPLLPGLGGNFGQEYLPMHAARWGGGDPANTLTMTLMDVWVLPPSLNEQLGGNLICWVPVDHDPAPPMVKRFFAESGAVPLAMSRFGQEQLSEFKALYCPHAVDTKAYVPHPREEARAKVGIDPNSFLCGAVSANKGRPSRKGFQQMFEAWKVFRDRHENAYLYLHTSLKPDWMQGEDLIALAASLDIPPESLLWADQYRLHFDPMVSTDMAVNYSAMDALLNPCTGGGFEIAQLEAAACGVPTITTDFTAMPESAGPTPWKVTGPKFWTGQKSWNMFADPAQIVDALEDCLAMTPKQKKALGKRMRRHAENYDIDRVFEEHMLPSVKKAERRISHRKRQFDATDIITPKPPVKKDSPSISVVTPWFNKPELAEDYWKALDGETTHEVLVVDNGSDPPVERAAIRLEENAGFCPANNIGLGQATGEAVLFLNNDIMLGEKGWLEWIRSALEPGVLVGVNMRSDAHTVVDGEVQPYIDGWCIAGMREDLVNLGGWDEDYDEPAYYSDNDLCLRARQAGMKLVGTKAPLVHKLNQTAGPASGVREVTHRNYKRYAAKIREAKVPA